MPCIFCEIATGRRPARMVYDDDQLLAVHDSRPQAPTHVLVLPRRHITRLLDLSPEDDGLVGALCYGVALLGSLAAIVAVVRL